MAEPNTAPTFPIHITQYNRHNLAGLYGVAGFIIFAWVFGPALMTAPPAAMIIVIAMFVTACVLTYLFTLGKKLTLTQESLTYKEPIQGFSFAYKDIQKVAYYGRFGGGNTSGVTLGIRFSLPIRRVRVFLKGKSQPEAIDLEFFADQDQLLVLDTLAKQAPQALYGDNIITILRTRTFPPRPALGRKVEDVHFKTLG